MPQQLRVGMAAAVQNTVTDTDTAEVIGSGDVHVLATPRLIAWAEAATVACLAGHLGEHETSVGTRIDVEHLLATPVGGSVTVRAETVYVDGRLVRFQVAATDANQRLVGRGEITRVVVARERFLARVPGL